MDIERVLVRGAGALSPRGLDDQALLLRFWHPVQDPIGTEMAITREVHLRGQHPCC